MALAEGLKSTISSLNNIKTNHLDKRKPKEFEAAQVFESELVNVGSDLFQEFFKVGLLASIENIKSFKDLTKNDEELSKLVKDVATLIADDENWIYRFLSGYPYFRIHIDEYEYIDDDVCQVRSGVQFMLDLFKGVDTNADMVIDTFINVELIGKVKLLLNLLSAQSD